MPSSSVLSTEDGCTYNDKDEGLWFSILKARNELLTIINAVQLRLKHLPVQVMTWNRGCDSHCDEAFALPVDLQILNKELSSRIYNLDLPSAFYLFSHPWILLWGEISKGESRSLVMLGLKPERRNRCCIHNNLKYLEERKNYIENASRIYKCNTDL